MKLEDSRIFVRQAIRGTLGSNKPMDIRYNLRTVDSRLLYIVSGRGEVTIDGTLYSLSPGSIILFKAGTPYMWNTKEMQFFIINFDYSDMFSHKTATFHPIHAENFDESQCYDCGEITDEIRLNYPIVLKAVPNLEPLFRLIIAEYGVGGEYSGELISNAAKTLIYAVLRYESESRSSKVDKSMPLVREIIGYIGENFDSEISNSTIAKKFHFNSSYINRVFKKHTGTTLHEYIIDFRIEVAAEKLRSESTSVSEIAKLTGFSGPAHFAKAFKKKMGISPTEYRNM